MDRNQTEIPARIPTRSLPSTTPTISLDDSMAEAGRRILLYHFEFMQANEPATRAGVNSEALHDMRVAARRMRAAIRLIGDYYEPDTIRRVEKGLKRTGRALGHVRDLDVLWLNFDVYLKQLPSARSHELDPVLWRWHQQREKARLKVLIHLSSRKHRDFLSLMEPFVRTEGTSSCHCDSTRHSHPTLVREDVPRLINEHEGRVRAYGTSLDDADIARLHALRIDVKRLRYTLEFFKGVLGEEVRSVIAAAVALQDHLGALHDAVMAQEFVQKGVNKAQRRARKWSRKSGCEVQAPDFEGAEAYLAYLEAVVAANLADLPGVWAAFIQPGIRQKLEQAFGVL